MVPFWNSTAKSRTFLSPRWGSGVFPFYTHSLRCGLHSYAALRLNPPGWFEANLKVESWRAVQTVGGFRSGMLGRI
jgi:hypothetical protein